jgi:hypothetical protein
VDFSTPKSAFRTAKTKYVGFEDLSKLILSRSYALPPATVQLANGEETLPVDPGAVEIAAFKITIPNDAPPGGRLAINIRALTPHDGVLGGVTIYFDVKQ